MLHYILQTVAFQLFFLAIYDLLLKKETFFNWNRFYLLSTAVTSMLLPLIKVQGIRDMVPERFVIRLPEVIVGNVQPTFHNNVADIQAEAIASSEIVWYLSFVIYAGMLLATLLFLYKLIKMFVLVQKSPRHQKDHLVIVNLLNSNEAFSFFNYVFLGEMIEEEEKETILKHELVHVLQNHSMDLLLFEMLRIAFWYNPLVYMYQNRMATLHEYIADEHTVKYGNKKHYYEKLLSQIFGTNKMSITNTFFNQSLIKKRIVMLNKSKSNRIHLLKYTLFIPMVFGMLIYTSCQIEADGTTTESLDKFSYTEKMPVEMTEALKKARGQFESFLINNKDYVAWAETDYEKSEVNYSIHKKDEKTPVGFTGMQVNFENGDSYMIYRDLSEEKQTSKEMHQDSGTFKDASEMPLSVIDEVPTTEACEKLATNDEKRDCLSFTISDFVNKNFNTNLGKELGLKGRQRIMVIFMIEKDGQIGDVRAKSQHPGLEAEAIRVVKMLPKMSPGMHNGKPMAVPYHLPILFQVGE